MPCTQKCLFNMHTGACTTASVQQCDYSTLATPYLAIRYLFLCLDIILRNGHRARDSPPSHPRASCGPVPPPVTRTNTTTHTRRSIYLTCYPSWPLTPHPTRASCGGPVFAHQRGQSVISCNEHKTQRQNTQHNLHNHN